MSATLAILAAYLAPGVLTATACHRRHRLTRAGQWALAILGWPLVLLADYCAEREIGNE